MGDMAKGIKSFKRGMTEEEKTEDTKIEKKIDEDKQYECFPLVGLKQH